MSQPTAKLLDQQEAFQASTEVRLRPGPAFEVRWAVPPLVAAIYPFLLDAFHQVVGATGSVSLPHMFLAAALLAAAIGVPLVALREAARLGRIAQPSRAQLVARRVALLAVASPPLYTLVGVVCYLAGVSAMDKWLLVAFWALMVGAVRYGDLYKLSPTPSKPTSSTVVALHGGVALAFIVCFLSLHLGNHLTAVFGADAHKAVMLILRTWYRSNLLEPVLLLAVTFLVTSGAWLAWIASARPQEGFRTVQIAAGVFLAFAIASHMNAVFYFARVHLGIDTDWNFGIGAPTGLLRDPWNIRLVPYYYVAVVAVVAHPFMGLRLIMLKHGAKRRTADRVALSGAATAFAIATAIMLVMCGLRLHNGELTFSGG